tara:strand:- start:2844 stop:3071 length:228 start_codon:yes stop_codon:yes gene_type:complete
MKSSLCYCVFFYISNKEDTKVYTPFFKTLDEAEEYANHMRALLPLEGNVVSEPYPVQNTSPEKLEEEFFRIIKNT